MAAKFKVGDAVNHPACPNNTFPAGKGHITGVTTDDKGSEHSYKVKCDKTGSTLPVDFKESELTAA